ncbi:MAG: type VI immunity family protein [Desulfococcaceae bacterium]
MRFEGLVIKNPKGKVLSTPTLSFFIYSPIPLEQLAGKTSESIRMYLDYIGHQNLKTFTDSEGQKRIITSKQIDNDMKELNSMSPDRRGFRLEYDSDEEGWVGEYGIYFYATDLVSFEFEKNRSNLIRFDFPPCFLERSNASDFFDFTQAIAGILPFQYSNIGYTFKRSANTKEATNSTVNKMIERFFGFDPCYLDIMDSMRDRTFSAHWINILDMSMIHKLGGLHKIEINLNGLEIKDMEGKIWIRGAKVPPIGDINDDLPDIGMLPLVSRVFRKARVQVPSFGDPEFDADSWLARMDNEEVKVWDNSLEL